MDPVLFLLIFITCAFISLLLCWIARVLFPKFRSGEYKPGPHRSDMPVYPASGREIKTIELPLVGGPAFTIAMVITGIWAGYLFHLQSRLKGYWKIELAPEEEHTANRGILFRNRFHLIAKLENFFDLCR